MRLIKLVLVLVVVLAACSDDGDSDSTDAAGGDEAVIEVTEFAYPTDTEVSAGGSVRWVNTSGGGHTVVFDTRDGEPADQAELDLPADGEATATLDAGAWAYHCGIHTSMVGALTVEG
jgi:plastocyanin